MASSHKPKARGPVNVPNAAALNVSSRVRRCAFSMVIIAVFIGAGVLPSPMISVVTPCDTLLAARPSPMVNGTADCPWMSMKPGAITRPVASMRVVACAVASMPAGAIVAIRSPRIPTSAAYHALPVPSIRRPFAITTS